MKFAIAIFKQMYFIADIKRWLFIGIKVNHDLGGVQGMSNILLICE